jgi:hypothetical protein
MKTKLCADCKKEEFVVNPNARYERKYCDKCSKKRKKFWDEQWKVKAEDLEDD